MRLPSRRVQVLVCLTAFFLFASAAFAQSLTVDKLVEFIKSSIKLKNSDKEVAASLSSIKMSEKLTPNVIEELQSAGAGPKTVEALRLLVTQSASLSSAPVKTVILAAPPVAPGGPPPSEEEKKKVIEDTRDFALSYVKSLPNFICLQVTSRSVDMHFQVGSDASWSPEDRIEEKLTFFDQKENYESLTDKSWDKLGGSFSRGEWATLLSEIFEPSTHTDFHWVRWATVRGKRAHAFEYKVEQEYSQETISYQNTEKITAGFHGTIFIEKGTDVVLRIEVIPDIPPSFPVQDVDQMVDYDYQPIESQTFLLPVSSTVTMRDGHIASRNEIAWRLYKKYSSDTSISFDTGDDKTPATQPEDKTKEQPTK